MAKKSENKVDMSPVGLSLKEKPFSVRLQVLKKHLTETERKVGQYFTSNPKAVYMSITEAVEDSGLGYGSIIRFCRKLGCSGFQEFKVLLAQELAFANNVNAEKNRDLVFEYAQKLQSELANTEKLIDRDVLINIARLMNKTKKILVAGIAGSASLAIGFDYKLSRIGINSSAVCDGYNLAIRAASLKKADVFFAISFSGATKDILSAAEIAKDRGATVISLTNFMHTPLAQLADFSLFSATSRDPLSCEVFSNISSDYVVETLFWQLYDICKDAEKKVEETFKAVSNRRI